MAKKDNITKEKERLMEEILYKRRSINFDNDLVLKTNEQATKSLNELIEKQNKVLNNELSDKQFDDLEKEIERDFGIKFIDKNEVDKQAFDEVFEKLKTIIIGQDKAVDQLKNAFRRPFVMGYDVVKNAIVICGCKGTGKHSAISEAAKLLSLKHIVDSYEVYTLDMSLYTSASKEALFLQDLFSAINATGSIICFDNIEDSYPTFLRMLSDLVCKKQITLNKRYINQKGQLIESQSGLVKNAISTIQAKDKYLIFFSENKNLTDYLGQDFDNYVLDKIYFDKIKDEDLKKIIDLQITKFINKAKDNLHVEVKTDDAYKNWLLANYDMDDQIESIISNIDAIYVQIAQLVLNRDIKELTINCDDSVYALIDEEKISLVNNDKDEKLKAINEELNEIVGLDNVKSYIKSLQSHVLIQQRRKMQGLKSVDISKHMIFTGNPGTGKTTIARLISRYMLAIGVLSKGQLVEVTRADLVGKYVGHTAPLTMEVIKSALGGVLFIDEAYSLYRGKDDSFGLEAIDTLVKAMEDHRDDLIVILAGYSKEMEEFLEANSGLKSRFPNIINFEDYSADQLLAIAKSIAKGKQYYINEEADEALLAYFDQVQKDDSARSGNGRLARNVVEKAIINQSNRLIDDLNGEINELKLIDFDLKES